MVYLVHFRYLPLKGKLSPLSKVAFSAKVSEEISETDIDEWHETPDVKWALWNMCFKLPQKGKEETMYGHNFQIKEVQHWTPVLIMLQKKVVTHLEIEAPFSLIKLKRSKCLLF